ncbi:MAG: hypothetical protein WCL32_02180 [Planctomycetota bacterium]
MRTRFFKYLLVAVMAALPLLAWPAGASAQSEVIPRPFVGPLSHPRYEDGGWYTAMEFLYMKQRNLTKSQPLVFRGFVDVDGSITGVAGTFVGNNSVALDANQVAGAQSWEPGFNLTLGYRFENGLALQASWWHLADVRSSAAASIIAPNYQNGASLENTFLFSPVYNVPPQFAGNAYNVSAPNANAGATWGIWNAASVSQISFVQRFDMVDLLGRIPVMQTDNYRSYGVFGPRGIVMWERFKWRTVDVGLPTATIDANGNITLPAVDSAGFAVGNAGGNTIGDYNNVVSNRLYGLVVGCGNEFRLGDTPVGTFSLFADLNLGLYVDFVKGRARYQLEDRSISYTYARNMFTLAPGFDTRIGFQWYIYEAITIRLGYNYIGLFNTVASPNPVDFNIGSARPSYVKSQFRSFEGLDFGIGLVW